MAEANLLETVKSMLGITGNYQDALLGYYIDEIKQYLVDGGVPEAIAGAPTSAGVIARGVCDIWNYGAGDGELSKYFKERAIQLSYVSPDGEFSKDHDKYHMPEEDVKAMVKDIWKV